MHTFVSYEMKQEYSVQCVLLECHFQRYYCSHQQKKIFEFKINSKECDRSTAYKNNCRRVYT